jgi:hypothetical protein
VRSRRHSETELLQVRCRDGIPIRFGRPEVRRGQARIRGPRWYRVRAVLASWVSSPAWWRTRAVEDSRIWRVEARREPDGSIGVFDLVERPDGAWTLARTHD